MLTKDQRRGEILGVVVKAQTTFTTPVPYISLSMLRELIKEQLARSSERTENSPTISEFMEYLSEHPKVHATGYVVSEARTDHRVTVDGLQLNSESTDREKLDFALWCHDNGADELFETKAWWS